MNVIDRSSELFNLRYMPHDLLVVVFSVNVIDRTLEILQSVNML